jgi:hypothetical protein
MEALFPHCNFETQQLCMNRKVFKPEELTSRKIAASITCLTNALPFFPNATEASSIFLIQDSKNIFSSKNVTSCYLKVSSKYHLYFPCFIYLQTSLLLLLKFFIKPSDIRWHHGSYIRHVKEQ